MMLCIVLTAGRFISSGGDGVRVWDVATGTLIDVLPRAGVLVAYSPDGKVVGESWVHCPCVTPLGCSNLPAHPHD